MQKEFQNPEVFPRGFELEIFSETIRPYLEKIKESERRMAFAAGVVARELHPDMSILDMYAAWENDHK